MSDQETHRFEDIPDAKERLELSWITSVLTKAGVPIFMVDKALQDPEMSRQSWRNYLFDNFGLEVLKDFQSDSTKIFRVNLETKLRIMIGEFKKPQVTRIVDTNKYIVSANAWQI